MAQKRKTTKRTTTRTKKPAATRPISHNPRDPNFVPANKGQKYPPEPLTDAEIRALIKACSTRAPTGVRNAALIVVLWRGQLRVSEALDLTPKDIDREAGTLRILHGKGDQARVVGLDTLAFAFIERWLDMRKARGINGRGTKPVFCTLKGEPLGPTRGEGKRGAYVRAMLKRMGERAGIEKRVHPHGLRHTGAAELRAEGADIGIISKQLGHKSIATTAKYLDHISPQAVIDAMRKREWSLE